MSLSEIRTPAAKLNPINTFYTYSLDTATLTADDVIIDTLEILGDLKVDGSVVGNVALSNNEKISMYVAGSTFPNSNTYNLSAGTGTAPSGGRSITIKDPLLSTTLVLSSNTGVQQATDITTTVTINAPSGLILTQATSLAALSSQSFTVNNSLINSSTSVILVSLYNYSGVYGTNGFPSVSIDRSGAAFSLIITNSHPTNALSGLLAISFLVA